MRSFEYKSKNEPQGMQRNRINEKELNTEQRAHQRNNNNNKIHTRQEQLMALIRSDLFSRNCAVSDEHRRIAQACNATLFIGEQESEIEMMLDISAGSINNNKSTNNLLPIVFCIGFFSLLSSSRLGVFFLLPLPGLCFSFCCDRERKKRTMKTYKNARAKK